MKLPGKKTEKNVQKMQKNAIQEKFHHAKPEALGIWDKMQIYAAWLSPPDKWNQRPFVQRDGFGPSLAHLQGIHQTLHLGNYFWLQQFGVGVALRAWHVLPNACARACPVCGICGVCLAWAKMCRRQGKASTSGLSRGKAVSECVEWDGLTGLAGTHQQAKPPQIQLGWIAKFLRQKP